jgi:serine/threonine protein phosphatase PrpC
MVWTALGDSVTGTSHRAKNVPCQDAHRYCTIGSGEEWLVIAAADGAGSASHSETGARRACDEFMRLIQVFDFADAFKRDAMTALFVDVQTALIAEAEALNVRARDLACTALLAVLGPESAAFAQVGDGAIVHSQDDHYRVVFWPEPAEYANATDFLTEERVENLVRFETVVDAISEVAVFTDGLQRLALDFSSRTAYPGFFQPLFTELRTTANAESLIEPFRSFLDSSRVNQRTDDDKTLVLAVRQK